MKKFIAFTLAETLIVMGIIGIVSALTLPNLNSSTGEKEKIAKVKKVYQNLNDAFGRAKAVYGPYEQWLTLDNSVANQTTRFGDRLSEFFKVSKNCGVNTNQGCFATKNVVNFKNESQHKGIDQTTYFKFITADGTSIALTTNTSSAPIYIDIDGPNKGKNMLGYDIFDFYLDNGDIVDWGADFIPYEVQCLAGVYGYASWVIKNDNMDYLKMNSSGKCPNGTVLNQTVHSCK